MSAITDRMATVRLAVDREWGEAFMFVPRAVGRDVDGAETYDATRTSRVVVGRWSDKTEKLSVADAYDQRSDKRPGVAGSRTTLFFSRQDAVEGEPELWVRHKDRFVRQSDGVAYTVSTAVPSGRLRIRCECHRTV